MEKEMKFRTNLQCENCVSKVKKDLDEKIGSDNWNVDINHSDKILTIKSSQIDEEEVLKIVKSKGFDAETLN